MSHSDHPHVEAARRALAMLGLPPRQQNTRSALCLLALLDLTPDKGWADAEAPLLGVTPLMEWVERHYNVTYAPNTRETIRKDSLKPFCEAGLTLHNPDQLNRPVNSPKAIYQLAPDALPLLRAFDTPAWEGALNAWLERRPTLQERYAQDRARHRVPLALSPWQHITLSPGDHSALIGAILRDFVPAFAPGCAPIYVGDTGDKWAFFDRERLASLGVEIDPHGKMPDVLLYDATRDWLLVIESVTSHGPVDGQRRAELARLFAKATAGLVYVTAFPNRAVMARHLPALAWETEVWVADAPSHLIHFNGERFLGPYDPRSTP